MLEVELQVQHLGEALRTCLMGLAAAATVALPMAGAPEMVRVLRNSEAQERTHE